MKKALLTLAFAAMAGIASAVSYTWNSSDGTFAGFKDTNGNVVTFSGDFSLTVKFTATFTSTSIPANIFKLMTANGADQPGELRWNSNSLGANKTNLGMYNAANNAYWKNSGGDFSTTRLTGGTGENEITFTFSGWNADAKTYANAIGYTITFANGDVSTNTFDGGAVGFGLDAITWTQMSSGEGIAVTGMTLNATPVTSVPEPTVLALLAMGVAGLALRRRA
ncbi:MAG: PEP-CTERM sorting domain-containing protein [Candidatus Spyradenecus sp.]